MPLRRFAIAVVLVLFTSSAFAREWHEAYRAGIDAAKKRDWGTVVAAMSEAISKKPKEEKRARPYGTVFINYRPYYYRGVANLNLGNYSDAIADLNRSEEPGEYPLGDIDDLKDKAQAKLSGGSTQPSQPPTIPSNPPTNNRPDPTPPTNTPNNRPSIPTTPTGPSAEEVALQNARSNADRVLRQAEQKARAALTANAPRLAESRYRAAETAYNNAADARAAARTANDWNRVADLADQASRAYDSALAASRTASTSANTKLEQSIDQTLAPLRDPLKAALRDYFGGRFERSARNFRTLTSSSGKDLPLLWAFQGAAIYYDYYLAGSSDSAKKAEAIAAFRRARALKPNLTLPSKYFSPRVRRFYEANAK